MEIVGQLKRRCLDDRRHEGVSVLASDLGHRRFKPPVPPPQSSGHRGTDTVGPMIQRLTASLLAMVLLAAACSSSEDEATTAEPNPDVEITQNELVAAADFIVDKWGGQEGFAIIVLAIDLGYTVDQLVGDFERLNKDGTIVGLEPRLEPRGLTSPAPAGDAAGNDEEVSPEGGFQLIAFAQELDDASALYVEFVDQTLAEIYKAAVEHAPTPPTAIESDVDFEDYLAAGIAVMVLGLMARGYTIEQAIQAMVLNTISQTSITEGCFYIEDEMPPGEDLLRGDCDGIETVQDEMSASSESTEGDSIDAPATDGSTAAPSEAEPETTVPLPKFPDDGIYEGVAPEDWARSAPVGDVIQNRITLQIEGGVLQSFDLFVDVRGAGAVFEADGTPMCLGDTLFSMRALTTPPIVDGVILLPVDRFGSRSNIQATAAMDGKTCNPALAVGYSDGIDLQITVSDGRADVRMFQDGELRDSAASLERTP
jgi:hypothetical protein